MFSTHTHIYIQVSPIYLVTEFFFPHIIPSNISQNIGFSENILGNPELSKDFRLIQGAKNLRMLAGEFGQEAPSLRASTVLGITEEEEAQGVHSQLTVTRAPQLEIMPYTGHGDWRPLWC